MGYVAGKDGPPSKIHVSSRFCFLCLRLRKIAQVALPQVKLLQKFARLLGPFPAFFVRICQHAFCVYKQWRLPHWTTDGNSTLNTRDIEVLSSALPVLEVVCSW